MNILSTVCIYIHKHMCVYIYAHGGTYVETQSWLQSITGCRAFLVLGCVCTSVGVLKDNTPQIQQKMSDYLV